MDFSTEMERTLSVLDYGILVINASDGVQEHTETLWRLLETYEVPTFIFLNKMDLNRSNHKTLMKEIKDLLSDSCIDFSGDKESREFMEALAMSDEELLDIYLEKGLLRMRIFAN